LLHIKNAVIAQQEWLRLPIIAVRIPDNLLFADVPKCDQRRTLALANVAAKFGRLIERQPVP
jgi:hypothetical protein